MRGDFAALILPIVLMASCGPQEQDQLRHRKSTAVDQSAADGDIGIGKGALKVKSLMKRAASENARCRGGHGDAPETMRACNNRRKLLIDLEKRGWCPGEIGEGRWVKCGEYPDYRPGQNGTEPPYSEQDIREATERVSTRN